jgi:nitroreductase
LLRDRRSFSSFDPEHVLSHRELTSLLEAAQWAPSAGNSQPWEFVVALRGDGGHRVIVDNLSRGNAGWVPHASAVLLGVTKIRSGVEEDAPAFSDYAEYDLGQAAAHVTLQAEALGLNAHQFAGFDHDAVAAALGVPVNFKVLAGMAIGRHIESTDEGLRDREARPRTRRTISDFAHAGSWEQPWS